MTHGRQPTRRREPGHSGGWPGRLHRSFESGFERLREDYTELLTLLLTRRAIVPIAAVLIVALGGVMLMLIGRDFFPAIDAGQIKLHVRAPAGARIESTEALFQAVEDKLRDVVPDQERELIVDDIGVPQRVYNLAFTDGSTIGPNDGVILVALREGHAPTESYICKLREVLPSEFPEATFYFQAADMVTQILNFGLPAQIDVGTVGRDRATNLRVAQELRRRIAAIPGIVDPHIQQEIDAPAFMVAIDLPSPLPRAAKSGYAIRPLRQRPKFTSYRWLSSAETRDGRRETAAKSADRCTNRVRRRVTFSCRRPSPLRSSRSSLSATKMRQGNLLP